jgi:branched-chain amino acid transport system substrate-binding protein
LGEHGRYRPEVLPFGVLAAVICLCLAAPTLAQQPTTSESGAEEDGSVEALSLGVAVPLSGEYAPLGKQVLEAAKLAARKVGVQVVSRDTEGTPVGAVVAVRELAADESVVAVLGPVGRRESRAAAQVAQRLGLPMLALASSDAINDLGGWIYRLRLTPAEQAEALAEAVREHLDDAARVGIFFPESNYGQEAAVAFGRRFAELGGEISAVASYSPKTSNFRKPLDELVGRRVRVEERARVGERRADGDGYLAVRRKEVVDFDLLFVPDFHRGVSRLLPFLPEAGIQTGEGGEGTAVQLLGLAGWQGSSMKHTGAHAAGAIYTDLYVGPSDGGRAEDFDRMFEAATGRRPVDLDAEVFDGGWVLAKALERAERRREEAAEPLSTAELRLIVVQRLAALSGFTGVSGPLEFSESGRPLRPTRLYQFDVEGTVAPWHVDRHQSD